VIEFIIIMAETYTREIIMSDENSRFGKSFFKRAGELI